MRKPMSLRLRVTLLCAALLTLCCLLLTVTNNFSAIRMAAVSYTHLTLPTTPYV